MCRRATGWEWRSTKVWYSGDDRAGVTIVTASAPKMPYCALMLTKALTVLLFTSAILFAHCDGLDGPVVKAARQALLKDDVSLVLPWIPAEQEPAVREAFQHARAVRTLNPTAEKVADTWLFETLVRIHRIGEGASYQGLKPTGAHVPALVVAADQAIGRGDIEALEGALVNSLRQALRQRFSRLAAAKEYPTADVKAGREYVAAYVNFMHLVEQLDASLTVAPERTHEHAH